MIKTAVFVTYESPWFPAGGIAAVMGQLPSAVQAAGSIPTVVITPFHNNSTKIAALGAQGVGTTKIVHNNTSVTVEILHYVAGCPWFFLRLAGSDRLSPPAFDGKRHPYDVTKEVLLRDSLFFGVATVQALPIIAMQLKVDHSEVEWNLIAQDWEAATAIIAFADQNASHGRPHLTLHNSYDEFASIKDLSGVGIDPACCPGDTILHRALSAIEQPAFTVSDQFALDFTEDLLQREIMAPQLQGVLKRSPIVGVDNGPFKPISVDPAHLRDAAIGRFDSLQVWKADNRGKALSALDAHVPTAAEPV